MPEQGKTQIGIWQTWDALRGGWFVGPEPIDDPDHGGAFFTLAEFAATHPGARIMNDVAKGGAAIRLSVGGPVFSPNFIGDADNFKIGVNGATITYDFELTIADAGPDKNVIYGYGSNCINLNGTADGGVAPYSYSWIPAGPSSGNDQLTICPTQNTMYTLTVTDSKGCVGTDDAMVTVKDVRCGTKLEKVAVCHRGEEICVAASSVAAHLNHGDALGACATSAIVRKAESAVKMDAVEVYKLSNYPNPFSGATKISYRVPYDAHVSVKVYDVAGNEIATLVNRYQKAGSYSTDFLPGKIKQGFYYYRLTTTSSKQNFSVAGKMMMVD
ncbi:MAG TPA: T9SS type A sorting domain-containing protein [Phnomibacter sp.]|nr:T9SS type A sorting domain-containing protein [Phnomibacter sp.]